MLKVEWNKKTRIKFLHRRNWKFVRMRQIYAELSTFASLIRDSNFPSHLWQFSRFEFNPISKNPSKIYIPIASKPPKTLSKWKSFHQFRKFLPHFINFSSNFPCRVVKFLNIISRELFNFSSFNLQQSVGGGRQQWWGRKVPFSWCCQENW